MSAVLQVFVRGCETQVAGERIVGVLEDYGFTVLERFDGQADSRGGLIETDIRDVALLDGEGDIEQLRVAVFALSPPGTFIQYRTFTQDQEGEVHGPTVRVHYPHDL